MLTRPARPERRSKHLCADAGYTGAPALGVIRAHGYIPHVKGRGQEVRDKRRAQAESRRQKAWPTADVKRTSSLW